VAYTTIHPITATVSKSLDYVKRNKIKSDGNSIVESETISSYQRCSKNNDYELFCKHRELYIKSGRSIRLRKDGKENLAFHLIQSFDRKLDPKLANEIGQRLAKEVLSNYSCVISTHSDSECTHNHIILNAYKTDGSGKWNDCDKTKDAIRKASDRLCEEYGLSVIEAHRDYKPIHWVDKNGRNRSFEPSERKLKMRESGDKFDDSPLVKYDRFEKKKSTLTEKIKSDIDSAVASANSYDNLIQILQKQGYVVKSKRKNGDWLKHTSFKPPEGNRAIRDSTLGTEYSRAKLAERIADERSKDKKTSKDESQDIDLKSFVQEDLSAKENLLRQYESIYGKTKEIKRLKSCVNENVKALEISERYGIRKLSNFESHLAPLPNQFKALNIRLSKTKKSLLKEINGLRPIKPVVSELKSIRLKFRSVDVCLNEFFDFIRALQRVDKERDQTHVEEFKKIEDSIVEQLENIRNGKALLSTVYESIEEITSKAIGTPSECPSVMPPLTTIAKMKSHTDYVAAKAGDTDAAYRLVNSILSGEEQKRKIAELARKYPDAVLVAVHAEEKLGRNKIPLLLMAQISKMTGIEYSSDIVQTNKVGRTGSDSMHRLAYRPKFDGKVQAGRRYILLDDVITVGGTLSELRCFIESKGGKVDCLVTVAAARHGTNFALSNTTRYELESRYGILQLEKFLKEYDLYGGKIGYLTESEGRTILAAGSLDSAGDRIAKARRERSVQEIRRTLGNGSSKKER